MIFGRDDVFGTDALETQMQGISTVLFIFTAMLLIAVLLALFALGVDYSYHQWLSHSPEFKKGGYAFAKFTPGAIISEIRNKIAATVYTKNRAGASIRNRVTPINRNSTNQTLRRQQLASLSSGWRSLTQAQRDGWNSASGSFPQTDSLGQTVYLTGEQLYVRCNANLLLTGNAQITDAPSPTSFDVLAFTSLDATADDGVISLAFTPTVPAGFELVVRASAPVSAGKSFMPSSAFKFIQSIAPAATSPQALTTAYANVFGAITGSTGQKIFVEMFLVEQASGLAGIPVRGSGVVLAT